MSQSLLDKITYLKGRYANPTDQSVIIGWEKEFEDAVVETELFNHPIIKKLVESWQIDVKGIETVLSTEKSLTQEERLRIMDRRDFLNRFISAVSGGDDKTKKVEKMVDEAISHYKTKYQDQ